MLCTEAQCHGSREVDFIATCTAAKAERGEGPVTNNDYSPSAGKDVPDA